MAWSRKQTRKLIALKSKQPGQTNTRKVSLLRRRHERLLGHKSFLSRAYVRPSFEQIRRQSSRHCGQLFLLVQRPTARDRVRIVAEQQTDLVLSLLDQAFGVRDR